MRRVQGSMLRLCLIAILVVFCAIKHCQSDAYMLSRQVALADLAVGSPAKLDREAERDYLC